VFVVFDTIKKGVKGIIELAEKQANLKKLDFTEDDEKIIREIFAEDSSFWKELVAQFKIVHRKGIAIVGPSGVGKTSLCHYLSGKRTVTLYSTEERKYETGRFNSRYVQIADTPGSYIHVNLKRESYDYIRKGDISILILRLGYGYLDTIGIQGFSRPGQRRSQIDTLEEYLNKTRQEEIEWLEDLLSGIPEIKKTIPYCMVVLNKMDHWHNEIDHVLPYYKTGTVREQIDEIVKKFCRQDVQASFHPIACTYNSFKGNAPNGRLSLESSLLSLHVLRAEIGRRLKEIA